MSDHNQRSLDEIDHEEAAKECPDCKSKKIEYRNGELFCTKCGLLIE